MDPLGLVQIAGGTPRINSDHKALVSIRDYIDRNGSVDGKRLTEHFSDAPFGWSPDTLRYLVAALLVDGEIKLKISGREIKVNGQQAIEALRTNNAFKTVGVSLREGRPSNGCVGACRRPPDGTDRRNGASRWRKRSAKLPPSSFPQFQHRFGPLAERLATSGIARRRDRPHVEPGVGGRAADRRLRRPTTIRRRGIRSVQQREVGDGRGCGAQERLGDPPSVTSRFIAVRSPPYRTRACRATCGPIWPSNFALLDERLNQESFYRHAAAPTTTARVTEVVDGDTIEVDITDRTYTVRYIGVNTPKTATPANPSNPSAKKPPPRTASSSSTSRPPRKGRLRDRPIRPPPSLRLARRPDHQRRTCPPRPTPTPSRPA